MEVTPFQGVNSLVPSWFVRLGHSHFVVTLVFVCYCDFMTYLMWCMVLCCDLNNKTINKIKHKLINK